MSAGILEKCALASNTNLQITKQFSIIIKTPFNIAFQPLHSRKSTRYEINPEIKFCVLFQCISNKCQKVSKTVI